MAEGRAVPPFSQGAAGRSATFRAGAHRSARRKRGGLGMARPPGRCSFEIFSRALALAAPGPYPAGVTGTPRTICSRPPRKLYTKWQPDQPSGERRGYALTTLVIFLAERRSPGAVCSLHRAEPEGVRSPADLDSALDLREALASLPRLQRATSFSATSRPSAAKRRQM